MVNLPSYKGAHLDNLLRFGYYRMTNDMQTCQYIINEHYQLLNVLWARYKVDEANNPLEHKLFKRNRRFKIVLSDFILNDEILALGQKYCNFRPFEVKFEASYFLNHDGVNLFDTRTIQIYDGTKLIAVGYFDEGLDAIMGLKNIYDPEYAKYSLGKFMMLCKMQYCKQRQIQFYYPGYIACESTIFDYKLFFNPECIQLMINGYWMDFTLYGSKDQASLAQIMKYELKIREDNLDDEWVD